MTAQPTSRSRPRQRRLVLTALLFGALSIGTLVVAATPGSPLAEKSLQIAMPHVGDRGIYHVADADLGDDGSFRPNQPLRRELIY